MCVTVCVCVFWCCAKRKMRMCGDKRRLCFSTVCRQLSNMNILVFHRLRECGVSSRPVAHYCTTPRFKRGADDTNLSFFSLSSSSPMFKWKKAGPAQGGPPVQAGPQGGTQPQSQAAAVAKPAEDPNRKFSRGVDCNSESEKKSDGGVVES